MYVPRIDAHRAVTRALLEHPSGHSTEKHEGVARFPLRYNSVINFDRAATLSNLVRHAEGGGTGVLPSS